MKRTPSQQPRKRRRKPRAPRKNRPIPCPRCHELIRGVVLSRSALGPGSEARGISRGGLIVSLVWGGICLGSFPFVGGGAHGGFAIVLLAALPPVFFALAASDAARGRHIECKSCGWNAEVEVP